MTHIPTELLHKIFIKLDLKDKLECMRVCRFWYDTLDRFSLLDTLIINDRVFAKLKEMIEHQPHRATQVERLTFQHSCVFNFDKRTLCNMFPKLRELTFPKSHSSHRETSFLNTPFQFTNSSSKLEKIVDSGLCELTRQLAMSSMFNNLKSLELFFTSESKQICSHVIGQLKNMPVLETLTLCYFRVKLMDLETLHRNLPSIKSLYLKHVYMISGEDPNDVIPATLIKKLDLNVSGADNLNTHILFYKYLTKKYPSLEDLTHDDLSRYPLNDNYVWALYNEGILPFYQNIGSHISHFFFKRYCDGLDAFRKFDESGIKLKELKVDYVNMNENENWREDTDSDVNEVGDRFPLDELVQSQQSKTIQKFILDDIIPAPLEMMMNMEALTYLEISFSDSYASYNYKFTSTINFDKVVDVCPPTLTELTINSMHLDCHRTPPSNITSIQNLKLVNVKITSGVEITETNFPELTALHVEAIIKDKLMISLPNLHLKQADIEVQYPEYAECYISVNTIVEGKLQCNKIWPGYKDPLYGTQIHCPRKPNYDIMEYELANLTFASVEKPSYFIYHKNNGDEECYDDEYY